MFSTAELAQMRADIASLYPDTCHIMGITRTSDGAGGWTDAAGTVTANVPCRFDFPKPGRESVVNGSNIPFKAGEVCMAWDTTVTTAHQLLKGGTTYNIIAVNDAQSWIGEKLLSVQKVP